MTSTPTSFRGFPTESSSTAFVVAGLLFAVFAGFWIVQTFGGAAVPGARGPFGAAGWLAAFVGLFGLYPVLVEGAEAWARTGLGLVAIGAAGATVSAVAGFGTLFGLWGEGPAWLGVTNFLIMVGIIPGFLAYGMASLRSEALPRSVGILLLLPAVIFLINLTSIAILASVGADPVAWGAMLLASAQTIVLLSIGLRLQRSEERWMRARTEQSGRAGQLGKHSRE